MYNEPEHFSPSISEGFPAFLSGQVVLLLSCQHVFFVICFFILYATAALILINFQFLHNMSIFNCCDPWTS